jgi:hypothetical protein
VGSILKWGLLAVAAVYAMRFISNMMDQGQYLDNGGPVNAPGANGLVWMYPGMVYPPVRPGSGRAWSNGGGGRGGRGARSRNGRGR